VEGLWANLKGVELANRACGSLEELAAAAEQGIGPTTTEPVPPLLPSCQKVLAFDRDGSVSGDDPTRIRLAPPSGRRVTVDLHYTGGAGGVDVRNCVSFTSSSGGREVVTQDTTSLCCVSFDRRFSILAATPAHAGHRGLRAGGHPRGVLRRPGGLIHCDLHQPRLPGGAGRLTGRPPGGRVPFTGPAHLLPLAPLAAVAVALGATALLVVRTRPQ
jgi:hypothetical protein